VVDRNACFAIAHVPMEANSATAIPDGMVVLFDPLVETKFGPQIAQSDTAIHMAVMDSDAQTSLLRKTEAQPR
jgi:hypothetical protein